jgi:type 1 glutamine amidotransferase
MALLLSPTTEAEGPGPSAEASDRRILVFSKTTGFRHASIPDTIAAVERLGAANGFAVDATEDSSIFRDERLAAYDAVLFLLTSGDVLDGPQKSAFERYIRAGGGFVGVHSASDTEYGWAYAEPLFARHLLGAIQFAAGHPDCDDRPARTLEPRLPSR